MNTTTRCKPLACLALCLGATAVLADDPCPIQRLTSDTIYSASDFGRVMKIDSGRLIISEIGATTACPGGGDPFGCKGGAIHSYTLVDGMWSNRQFIFPPDIGFNQGFGNFDVEGDRLVSTRGNRDLDPRLGSLFVYEFDDASAQWVLVAEEPAPDWPTRPTTGFGVDIALRGDSVMIGRGEHVLLYQEFAEGWQHVQTITAPDTTDFVQFGYRLALTDDWAIIAALDDRTRGYEHGALYVYRRDAQGMLEFHEKVLPPYDPGAFGPSLSLDGTTLAVYGGGPDPAASVFVYELTAAGLELRQDVTVRGGEPGLGFGFAISVRGDTMVCGSGSTSQPDRVGYVFRRRADGLWRQVGLLDTRPATPTFPSRYTAWSTATDGRYAVLSATDEFVNFGIYGAAYSFDLDCAICEADLDFDGRLTLFDFLAFGNAFDTADPIADLDGDGAFTLFDFLAFQDAFDAGCG
ncbi:MAG: GC-type dockerin domain-anchored protein [Phycisphaerales bacterium]